MIGGSKTLCYFQVFNENSMDGPGTDGPDAAGPDPTRPDPAPQCRSAGPVHAESGCYPLRLAKLFIKSARACTPARGMAL
jgi:hypothetical protein